MSDEANNNEIKPEVKPEPENKKENVKEVKTFTQEQVNEMISARLGKFKEETIQSKVDERTELAIATVNEMKAELEATKRTNLILSLSKEHGVKESILDSSGLSGENLENFAAVLAEERKEWVSNSNSSVTVNDKIQSALSQKNKENNSDSLDNIIRGQILKG